MTRQIELSKQGKNRGKYVAIVDDADFDRVNQYRWCAMPTKGPIYAVRFEGQKCITMHEFVLGVKTKMPAVVIDHKDGDGLNNSRSNIRVTNQSNNLLNSKPRGWKTFKGVCATKHGTFKAAITVNHKRVYIGSFKTEIDAALAYNEAALKYHGEFARLNVIPD